MSIPINFTHILQVCFTFTEVILRLCQSQRSDSGKYRQIVFMKPLKLIMEPQHSKSVCLLCEIYGMQLGTIMGAAYKILIKKCPSLRWHCFLKAFIWPPNLNTLTNTRLELQVKCHMLRYSISVCICSRVWLCFASLWLYYQFFLALNNRTVASITNKQ